MATAIEIIYKIKERDSSFNVTDDYKIDDELILSFMNDVRSTLIREEFNRTRVLSPEFYQMNCCYEINCIESGCEYNGEVVPDGSSIQTVKLKSHVKGLKGNEITYVGNKDGSFSFDILSFEDYNSMDGRVWTKHVPAAVVIGSEMRLKNLPTVGMKFVCIKEILEDPTTACNWDDNETDYPVPSVTKLVDMVLYRIMSKLPSDKINNATDDTTAPKIQAQEIAKQQKLQTQGN